jgi:hypothetical protein
MLCPLNENYTRNFQSRMGGDFRSEKSGNQDYRRKAAASDGNAAKSFQGFGLGYICHSTWNQSISISAACFWCCWRAGRRLSGARGRDCCRRI